MKHVVLALSLCLLAVPAHANQWILDHFAGLPVVTGPTVGMTTVFFPLIVKDLTCTGGYKCIVAGQAQEPSPDQRVAFVNVTVADQVVSGIYGSGIETYGTPGEQGQNLLLDTFISKVTIASCWPDWMSYQTTNMDGITFNAGWQYGHVYAEDLTIACLSNPAGSSWADAAVDVKPGVFQAVRMKTNGRGHQTLRFWFPGPHYIVDSEINNADGSLIWTYSCPTLEVRIWNSTFNGSSTVPPDRLSCDTGEVSSMTITYLTVDPRTTGEMHPMFTSGTAPPPPAPVNTWAVGGKIRLLTALDVYHGVDVPPPWDGVKCRQTAGMWGSIYDGPVVKDGIPWWGILFNEGCGDGWVPQAERVERLQLR